MKQKKLIAIIIVVIMAIIGLAYIQRKGTNEALSYEFDGRVDHVRYNIKGQAYVVIKNKEYYLLIPIGNLTLSEFKLEIL